MNAHKIVIGLILILMLSVPVWAQETTLDPVIDGGSVETQVPPLLPNKPIVQMPQTVEQPPANQPEAIPEVINPPVYHNPVIQQKPWETRKANEEVTRQHLQNQTQLSNSSNPTNTYNQTQPASLSYASSSNRKVYITKALSKDEFERLCRGSYKGVIKNAKATRNSSGQIIVNNPDNPELAHSIEALVNQNKAVVIKNGKIYINKNITDGEIMAAAARQPFVVRGVVRDLRNTVSTHKNAILFLDGRVTKLEKGSWIVWIALIIAIVALALGLWRLRRRKVGGTSGS